MENKEDKIIITKNDTILNHLEISVSESEKRANGTLNLKEFYTVYLIESKLNDSSFQDRFAKLTTVWRRYTEFEHLRVYLEVTYPYVVLPPLPEKRVLYQWQKISSDTFDPNFVDRRRAGLENFLLRIASHSILGWDKHFIEFLQNEDWKDSINHGYLQILEQKFKNLHLMRLRYSDPRFESLKNYSHSFQNHLNNLLKIRSRVAEKNYNVHKLHANYGRVFSEWSAVEKEMGDSLQKAGHYLDSLASSIDTNLEDEELLADQLKEYLFFANSLQNVCKNYELHQLQLESAEDNVAHKNVERNKAQQGKTGLMSRLFGAIDTDEVRELKVNLLDQQIEEGALAVTTSKTGLNDFSGKSFEDIERFQKQKVLDLQETLTSYALLQLKSSKKGLQTWIQIKDCLENIL